MKHVITRILLLSAVILAAACSNDSISPDDLFNDSAKVVKTKITLKSGDDGKNMTASFATANVYRTSEFEGYSWLSAWSGGKMVYDSFFLSVYFQDIDKMKVGDTLKPGRFCFSFPLSSNSEDYTTEYSGKITLADKGDDYVILDFRKVEVSVAMGDYVTDGYLYCPLWDKFDAAL